MRNLEQIRAKNAFAWRNKIREAKGCGKPHAVVKKVPTQIIQNGFLGALAFAIENNGTGYEDVFNAILDHLLSSGMNQGIACDNLQEFVDELSSKCDGDSLRAITAESLAFLNFLRRFVQK